MNMTAGYVLVAAVSASRALRCVWGMSFPISPRIQELFPEGNAICQWARYYYEDLGSGRFAAELDLRRQ